MTKITNSTHVYARRGAVFTWLAAALAAGSPDRLEAQALDLDFAIEQAFTTLDDMRTPTGYRVGMAIPWMIGPVGFELGYRTVSEDLGVRTQQCGLDTCTPGPFDTVMRMRAATLGVGVSRMLNPFVELSAGVTGSLTWQDTEYRPRPDASPGAYGTERVGPDPGLGAYTSLRFPPLLSALRPFLYARAEWIAGGACAADAACFGDRYLGSAGIGMYARIP